LFRYPIGSTIPRPARRVAPMNPVRSALRARLVRSDRRRNQRTGRTTHVVIIPRHKVRLRIFENPNGIVYSGTRAIRAFDPRDPCFRFLMLPGQYHPETAHSGCRFSPVSPRPRNPGDYRAIRDR
jgi:hypothetical protein